MDDRGIVALYWRRDEAALRATEEKYGSYLGKIACQILGDWEDSRSILSRDMNLRWDRISVRHSTCLTVEFRLPGSPV